MIFIVLIFPHWVSLDLLSAVGERVGQPVGNLSAFIMDALRFPLVLVGVFIYG